MGSIGWKPLAVAVLVLTVIGQTRVPAALAQARTPDALARARQAYNAGQLDAAIAAATEARNTPALANAAAVVLGRAYLDRYRQHPVAGDLDDARKALQQVAPDRLSARDHAEFLIGLGLSLYWDGCSDGCLSAAAEMFKLALAGAVDATDRDRVFEWWASALDRQAQFGPESDRAAIYRRLLDGAEAELAKHDQSLSASYWLAAAARGTGDLERAMGASIAAWIRAKGFGAKGEALRVDLDRFVTQVLLPERARQLAPDADARPQLAGLVQQWEEIKKKYD